jgi:hypothetical protein
MATTNKIFVSPGVYTSERDLSFVAQSVGVTTLGLVGETLTGPAFEPIFITSYDEFEAFFGGTLPEKFVNTQIPKYELAYIAKSYLQQSNQLFVTRVLGLSGYDAGPSWSLLTVANVDGTTVDFARTNNIIQNQTWTLNFVATQGGTVSIAPSGNSLVNQNLNNVFTLLNGNQSSISAQLTNQILGVVNSSGVTQNNTVYFFGTVPEATYQVLTSYTAQTNVFGVSGLTDFNADFSSPDNDAWYYANFNEPANAPYSGYSFFSVVTSFVNNGLGTYTGTLSGVTFNYSGKSFADYDEICIATLRSRGISTYGSGQGGPQYQITGLTSVGLNLIGTYSAATQNPFARFAITGVTDGADTPENFSLLVSFSQTDQNYLPSVMGRTNFGKSRFEIPLFVEEIYPSFLTYAYNKGYIRGIKPQILSAPGLRYGNILPTPTTQNNISAQSMANYLERYRSGESPWVVSQLRGSTVDRLFKVLTISDGDSSNIQVKISIQNISFGNLSFDLGVRDFYDTDTNPVYLEKFTNCSMDPSSNSYIGVKIGTSDGEYALNSKYIMLELNTDAPVTSLPCGFEGYEARNVPGFQPAYPIYKLSYNYPGEVIYNPPFGSMTGPTSARGMSNAIVSQGDKVRTTFLGISSQIGYDVDFYQYKGAKAPLDICTSEFALPYDYQTQGFHMDSGATVVQIVFGPTAGTPAFLCGNATFQSDPDSPSNPYYQIQARKFTFLVQKGYDGWDIYREYRTNGDQFVLGGSGYQRGACASTRYPNATGWGAFKPISISNFTDYTNTDYYAYLLGISTFNNPESTNINVFATPGIDYVNNSNLVEDAISMITYQRADSIYIATTPDCNVFLPTNIDNFIYPTEAVDNLDEVGIDSNYTATYYPWILVRDTVNNTQIYIPPTNEVCRNLALTDNISFPWFATAGYTRGLVNAIKARKKLTQEDRDTLYQGRINPIATFSDVGTVIWGNKTLQIADTALNRINVRRLLLQARKLISAVAVRLLFEQNDAKVRQDFLDSVNPILDAIRRDRGLYDFRVTVSSSPEDLDRNTLTGKIYLKPTKALEFIDIEFLITPTGASFENI